MPGAGARGGAEPRIFTPPTRGRPRRANGRTRSTASRIAIGIRPSKRRNRSARFGASGSRAAALERRLDRLESAAAGPGERRGAILVAAVHVGAARKQKVDRLGVS